MTKAQGRCLCGHIRYQVSAEPLRTTVCHCTFCQRATGGAYMVQPVFTATDFALLAGEESVYTHISEGSGKEVYVHFCATCCTKLYLTFERFPGFVGLYAGTFDDPNWFEMKPENVKHIYVAKAQRGTVIPPHINTFLEHVVQKDGTAVAPTVFDAPHVIDRR